MLSGKMPVEHFPVVTECQGSEDAYYTKHSDYKIYPNVFLTDNAGSKPKSSSGKFEKATKSVQAINAGIFVNDPSCKLTLRSSLVVKNFILARYTGKVPLSFYGPKTKAGERFKLVLVNNDLSNRYFAKANDMHISSGSISTDTFR